MGYTKSKETTAEELSLVPLPSYDGDTYTVIRHKFVIDAAKSLLNTHGFNIIKESYKSNHGSNVAQGIYQIESTQDEELGMMFAWTNSYDKSTGFHTGNADQEAFNHIGSQIKEANKHFTALIKDKEALKQCYLNKRTQAELAGRLFLDEDMIDGSQMGCIKKEMNKPSYEYNADLCNAWTFYNHVTHALKTTHPKAWMSDQKKFHEFMTAELLSHNNLHNFDQTADDLLGPNSNEWDADEEAQDEVFGEFKI